MRGKHERLFGWGHAPLAECLSFRPEKKRELQALVKDSAHPVIARGLGRSYGDASLQPQGVIRTERFDHFIEFDPIHGIVRAQAGVSLAELMDFSIPKGWLPPVLPGTRHVTLGGAFACNVHGKNHFRDGDFAEHVLSIRLLKADGQTVECSPAEHGDLFWATAGGMGMTGIIEDITLQLKPIRSASLKTITYRVDSITDMVAAFENYRNHCDYMVGWIDHMAHGADIGRGVFEAASHIGREEGGEALGEYRPLHTRFSVPFFMPSLLLNRYSMALYNKRRFKRYSSERQHTIVGFNGFFHPLDGIGHWYRLYGKRGFFQYQCIIPETLGIASQLHTFLTALQQHKLFSYLAVIKYHREGKGLLTFPIRGYSLALDFPNTARVRSLVPQLNRWVTEQGGRVYLAKDALLSPEHFEAMYGEDGAHWRDIVHDVDPYSRFHSLMSQRLGWKLPHASL